MENGSWFEGENEECVRMYFNVFKSRTDNIVIIVCELEDFFDEIAETKVKLLVFF